MRKIRHNSKDLEIVLSHLNETKHLVASYILNSDQRADALTYVEEIQKRFIKEFKLKNKPKDVSFDISEWTSYKPEQELYLQ